MDGVNLAQSRRMDVLLRRVDEQNKQLASAIERLEAMIEVVEAKRGPGRPRKDAA